VGTQYRSAIFYHTAAQKEAAEKFIAGMTAGKLFSGRIVTEVAGADVLRSRGLSPGIFREQ